MIGTDTVLCMYPSQTWCNQPDGYGDGDCFLFRLKPAPEKYSYKVVASHIASFDDEEENIRNLEDAGQLMISSSTFISMGVEKSGARLVSVSNCQIYSFFVSYLLLN